MKVLAFLFLLISKSVFCTDQNGDKVEGKSVEGRIANGNNNNYESNKIFGDINNVSGKILTGGQGNRAPVNNQMQGGSYPQSPDQTGMGSGPSPNYQESGPTGVSEIYLQIIGAIEKIVGRMDKLDGRIQTMENILYHLTTNKKDPQPQQGNCPEKFVKIDGIRGKCLHISTLAGPTPVLYDWQSGHKECHRLGARLSEMIHYDDFLRISQFLVKHGNFKDVKKVASSDFWVGGINPGLIWIWSESGQQVGMDGRFWNENDNSSNAPGCLKLSYSHRLDAFYFKGAPCLHSQNIICEVLDNTVSRALAKFELQLNNSNSTQQYPLLL